MADGDLTGGSSLSIIATIMRTFGDQMEKKDLNLDNSSNAERRTFKIVSLRWTIEIVTSWTSCTLSSNY